MHTQAIPVPSTPAYCPQHQTLASTHFKVSAEQLLQLQAELLGRKRFGEAATALAQRLASCLKCDRATLGWREKGMLKVVAASYVAEVHAREETARLVGDAMEEARKKGAARIPRTRDQPAAYPARPR